MLDYKNGEDYICALCGEKIHTAFPLVMSLSLPRPDRLCDGCWELKVRVEMQPDLARRVLQEMGDKDVS